MKELERRTSSLLTSITRATSQPQLHSVCINIFCHSIWALWRLGSELRPTRLDSSGGSCGPRHSPGLLAFALFSPLPQIMLIVTEKRMTVVVVAAAAMMADRNGGKSAERDS